MDFHSFDMLDRYEGIRAVTAEELTERWRRLSGMMALENYGALVFPDPSAEGLNLWLTGERGQSMLLFYGDALDALYAQDVPAQMPAHPAIRRDARPDMARLRQALAGKGRLGLVFAEGLTLDARDALRQWAPDAEWRDASLPFSRVKGRKTPFERALIGETARMIQKVFEAFPSICREGRLYKDICDELQYMIASLGSDGEYMIAMLHVFDHDGRSLTPLIETTPGMRAGQGHQIALLVETNGPGGYYSVLGRVFSFGTPSESFARMYEVARQANHLAGQMMRPGATPRAIADAVNAYIRACGYTTDNCCFMHSLGCNMGESPALGDYSHGALPSPTENDPLEAGMQLHCHPHVGFADRYTSRSEAVRVINMYIVSERGGIRLDTLSEEIVLL